MKKKKKKASFALHAAVDVAILLSRPWLTPLLNRNKIIADNLLNKWGSMRRQL